MKDIKGFIDFDNLQLIFSIAVIAIFLFLGLKFYQLYKEDRLIQSSINEISAMANFYKKQFPSEKDKINFAEKRINNFLKKNGTKLTQCIKEKDPIICIKTFGMGENIPIDNKEDLIKAIETLEKLKSKL